MDHEMDHERLQAMTEMARRLVHDLNNALSPITGYADLIAHVAGQSAGAEQTRVFVESIQTATAEIATQLTRLRETYRPRVPDRLVRTSLSSVVHEALTLTESDRCLRTDVILGVGLADTPALSVEPSDLRLAIAELIRNALEAMPSAGELSIVTRASSSAVELEVRDSGVGMSDEMRRRCLEPFVTSTGRPWAGLGLTLVYAAVRRHGGEIAISTEPGRGTTVTLRLPLTDGKMGTAQTGTADILSARPPRAASRAPQPSVAWITRGGPWGPGR
jgi:signal transduction histidine kinase